MIGSDEDYLDRYNSLSDEEKARLSHWGNSPRQIAMNMRTADKIRECGFNIDYVFDEYGWLKYMYLVTVEEKIHVYGEEPRATTVSCAKLPNGKWVNGYECYSHQGGVCSGVSIWSKQYDSKMDAKLGALRYLYDYLKRNHGEKAHIAAVVKAMDGSRQLSLF